MIGDTNAGDRAPAGAPSVPNESSDLVTDDSCRRAPSVPNGDLVTAPARAEDPPVPNVLQQIADHFTVLAILRATWQEEIAQLEAAGMYDAAPAESWETRNGQGKYLRLIFPQHDGTRRKTYIGSYPSAIAEARAKIARRQRWEELTRNLDQVGQAIGRAERELASVERGLRTALSWGQTPATWPA